MKVNFLLGSGISLKSGVPGVSDVTRSLLEDQFLEQGDQFFKKWNPENGDLDEWRSAKPIQDYLSILFNEHDEYLNGKLGDGYYSSYEDIYSLLDQIEKELLPVYDNYALSDFIDRQIEVSKEFRDEYSNFDTRTVEMKKFMERAKHFIEDVIRENINIEIKNLEGVEILKEVITNSKVTKLNLFSLNHDLIIETICKQHGVKLVDGLDEQDGDVRLADSTLYEEESKVKLFKLHGGVNWYWFLDHSTGKQSFGEITGGNIWDIKTESGKEVQMLVDDENFLTGINKIDHYNDGFFGDLQYYFSTTLRNSNRLAVSGYGWNDRPINRKLYSWLDFKEDSKLMIIHGDRPDFVKKSRFLTDRILAEYIKNGKIVFLEKWFEELTLDDILSFHDE